MDRKYLPSKQFIIRVLIIAILIIGVFSVYKLVDYIKNRPAKDKSIQLVSTIQKSQKDSNNNEIPDWEERLWGLDPNKDGKENKEYIMAKRKTLNPNADLSGYGTGPTSENEALTREFFSIIMSLQQTGNLNDEAIQAISGAYSKQIEAEPIPDVYTMDMLNVVEDNPENMTKYAKEFNNLIIKYKESNMGDELTFLIQAISYDDPKITDLIEGIGDSYEDFGKDLIKIPTPTMMSFLSINLANTYDKNAQTTRGLSMIFSDPLIATKSVVNYKKYNDLLYELLSSFSYVFE